MHGLFDVIHADHSGRAFDIMGNTEHFIDIDGLLLWLLFQVEEDGNQLLYLFVSFGHENREQFRINELPCVFSLLHDFISSYIVESLLDNYGEG